MPEEATYLKMLRVVVFEPAQYWRPKFQGWFAVLPSYGPHPMRILLIRNGTSLKKIKIFLVNWNFESHGTYTGLIVRQNLSNLCFEWLR